jgi:hypothetical protein
MKEGKRLIWTSLQGFLKMQGVKDLTLHCKRVLMWKVFDSVMCH